MFGLKGRDVFHIHVHADAVLVAVGRMKHRLHLYAPVSEKGCHKMLAISSSKLCVPNLSAIGNGYGLHPSGDFTSFFRIKPRPWFNPCTWHYCFFRKVY